MPIYPRTYHHWQGSLGGPVHRLRAFATAGVAVAWRSRWLQRALVVTWLPAIWGGIVFFFAGQVLQPSGGLGGLLADQLGPDLTPTLRREADAQAALWTSLIYYFLHFQQGFWTLVVVAIVGPGLIAADRRHQAHEIYFARPVGWTDYLVGKLAVIALFVGAVTVVPALILYAESVLVSPDLSILWKTWHIVPRLLAIWVVWAVATGLPVLALSSLGTGSRLVGFLWVAGFVGSELVADVIWFAYQAAEGFGPGGPARAAAHWSDVLSLHDNLTCVAHGLLGVDSAALPLGPLARRGPNFFATDPGQSPWVAAAVLAGLALISLVILRVRVRPEGAV